MSFPASLSTCRMTVGGWLKSAGADMVIESVTVQADFGGPSRVSVDGVSWTTQPEQVSLDGFDLPHVDQIVHDGPREITMWSYTVTVRAGGRSWWWQAVQPLTGQSTLDLDELSSTAVWSGPQVGQQAVVTSINGLTGAVVLSGGGGGGASADGWTYQWLTAPVTADAQQSAEVEDLHVVNAGGILEIEVLLPGGETSIPFNVWSPGTPFLLASSRMGSRLNTFGAPGTTPAIIRGYVIDGDVNVAIQGAPDQALTLEPPAFIRYRKVQP